MINALGFVEILGLTAGIEASDAMLKSANVRLLNYDVLVPGLVTVVVEGDLAACRAAVDAGAAAAGRIGTVVSRAIIGRPDADTEGLVLGLSGMRVRAPAPQPSTPPADAAGAPDGGGAGPSAPPSPDTGADAGTDAGTDAPDAFMAARESESDKGGETAGVPVAPGAPQDGAPPPESLVLALLERSPQGATIGETAAHLHTDLAASRQVLDRLVKTGKLRKRGSRYRIRHQGEATQ